MSIVPELAPKARAEMDYDGFSLDEIYEMGWNDLKSKIEEMDIVPIVRCKDCIYWLDAEENEKGFFICPASGMEITEDDFCSYGEEQQWNGITDVDFEHTNIIWFHTKHGKDVEIAKVVRCKDCKHWKKEDWNIYVCHPGNHAEVNAITCGEWFCADGEKEKV